VSRGSPDEAKGALYLGALDVKLTAAHVQALDKATTPVLPFPTDMLAFVPTFAFGGTTINGLAIASAIADGDCSYLDGGALEATRSRKTMAMTGRQPRGTMHSHALPSSAHPPRQTGSRRAARRAGNRDGMRVFGAGDGHDPWRPAPGQLGGLAIRGRRRKRSAAFVDRSRSRRRV
jgi:hypothetical protein